MNHLVPSTNDVAPNQTVRQILHPKSVAIVGASADEEKWGGRLLRYMLKHRHDGPLYPINARANQLLGIQAFPSIQDCPGPVDLAILLVPKDRVHATVEDCVAKGVGAALCITAGFAETGPRGREDEEAVVALARNGGVRIIGPNCMGLMNAHANLAATTGMIMSAVERLPKGGIGLASQSGALMGAMLSRGVDIGAGFSVTVSVGNQADMDLNDFFEYMIDDPLTEVACLYMEGVKDPKRFTQLLARAAAESKPVCIVKSGRSEAGARAAMSHTASMAGEWATFEATCRRWGVYLFETIYDLVQGAQILQRGKRASSHNIAVFSASGGGGALLADSLEAAKLPLASLADATKQKLAKVLPSSHCELPIDFGMLNHMGEADPAVAGGAVGISIDRVMADDGVGAGILLLTTQPQQERAAEAVLSVADRTEKPLLFVQGAGNFGEPVRAALRAARYGFFDSPHDAVKVVEVLSNRASPASEQTSSEDITFPANLQPGFLTEPDARRLVESVGVPTTKWKFAKTSADAVQAAKDLAGPVAIKAVSAKIVHKSDIGAVKLGVRGDDAIRTACDEIAAAAHNAGVNQLDGYLVTEMWKADLELILGIQNDPDFGPMVMVGAGGVWVELLKDVQLAPAPLSHEAARQMIERLRIFPLLAGFRGGAPSDLNGLANLLVRLGALATASEGRVRELDINPLFIRGDQIAAADARATLV